MPYRKLKRIMTVSGLHVDRHDWYLAFPMHIPMFSRAVNAVIHVLPFVRRLGLVEVIVARKSS
jgi:hypothetical protein